MNVKLLDPFASNLPTQISTTLSSKVQLTLSFSSSGTLLATGTSDGNILVWDLQCMKLMRKYQGHCHLVVGVSFSGCSKHVLGCSLDWNLSIWDLYKDGDRRVVKFDCPVLSAEFNPIDPNIILVLTNSGAILLTRKLPVLDFDFEGHGWSRTPLETTSNSPTTFATFAPTGRSIYLCNSKGFITIFNTSGKLLQETRLGSFQIKQIKFHNNEMIVNSDRIIRLYHISNKYSDNNDDFIMNDEIAEKNEVEFNLVMKFQDVVERSQFIQCSFSHDSEYVCAASTTGNRHDIYVWDKLTGVLVKLLQGPFEGLCDFEWHPTMPMVASISNYNGNVYIWRDIGVQKYGCFDPTFIDIEDNIHYVEKETEFDEIETKADPILHDYSQNVNVF